MECTFKLVLDIRRKILKLTFGRKFWSCIVGLILLFTAYVLGGMMNKEAITGVVIVSLFGSIVLLVGFYIGGNVLKALIQIKGGGK